MKGGLRPPDLRIDSFLKVPDVFVVDSDVIQVGPSYSIRTDCRKLDPWDEFSGFGLSSERALDISYILVEEVAGVVSLN